MPRIPIFRDGVQINDPAAPALGVSSATELLFAPSAFRVPDAIPAPPPALRPLSSGFGSPRPSSRPSFSLPENARPAIRAALLQNIPDAGRPQAAQAIFAAARPERERGLGMADAINAVLDRFIDDRLLPVLGEAGKMFDALGPSSASAPRALPKTVLAPAAETLGQSAGTSFLRGIPGASGVSRQSSPTPADVQLRRVSPTTETTTVAQVSPREGGPSGQQDQVFDPPIDPRTTTVPVFPNSPVERLPKESRTPDGKLIPGIRIDIQSGTGVLIDPETGQPILAPDGKPYEYGTGRMGEILDMIRSLTPEERAALSPEKRKEWDEFVRITLDFYLSGRGWQTTPEPEERGGQAEPPNPQEPESNGEEEDGRPRPPSLEGPPDLPPTLPPPPAIPLPPIRFPIPLPGRGRLPRPR